MRQQFGHLVCSLLVAALGGVGCRREQGGAQATPPPVAHGPNVVLFVLDTTRPDFLSCYGHGFKTTPHIDRLAEEGLRFERAFSTYFWTVPAHATLLSGLYPSEAGVTGGTVRLPEEVRTVAERLRDAGYATGAVVANPWLSTGAGFAQGFQEYQQLWAPEVQATFTPGDPTPAAHRITDWLDRHAPGERPFFLFVNINIPHLPYTPPANLQRRFARRVWPQNEVARLREFKDELGHLAGEVPLSDQDYEILRDLYAAEIAETDMSVGIVLDWLRAKGVLDETLFVLTADHGESIGEHGLVGHMFNMHDTTMHVPLIVRYPSRFQTGVSTELLSSVYLVPAILDICGVEMADDDRLLARRGLGRAGWRPPEYVLGEREAPANLLSVMEMQYANLDFTKVTRPVRMYRTSTHKLITCDGGPVMLFDLRVDPGELHDLAADQPQVREELVEALEHAMEGIEVLEVKPQGVDPKSLDALRGLGYIK